MTHRRLGLRARSAKEAERAEKAMAAAVKLDEEQAALRATAKEEARQQREAMRATLDGWAEEDAAARKEAKAAAIEARGAARRAERAKVESWPAAPAPSEEEEAAGEQVTEAGFATGTYSAKVRNHLRLHGPGEWMGVVGRGCPG